MPVWTSHKPKRVVLIDCDGFLVDYVGRVLEHLNNEEGSTDESSGLRYAREGIIRWDIAESLGIDPAIITKMSRRQGFCMSLDPLPNTREFMKAAMEVADVYVVTTPTRSAYWHEERVRWLSARMAVPGEKVIFAHDKNMIRGDILVDDSFTTVHSWARRNPNKLGILWNTPHNQRDEKLPSNAFRCSALEVIMQEIVRDR